MQGESHSIFHISPAPETEIEEQQIFSDCMPVTTVTNALALQHSIYSTVCSRAPSWQNCPYTLDTSGVCKTEVELTSSNSDPS